MILVIDSGATNSNWKLLFENGESHFERYRGFNLSTHHIDTFPMPGNRELYANVDAIFFFGAGVGNPKREILLRNVLTSICPKAVKVIIGSDLNSAAIATSIGSEGAISILGTGSNCCIFNGQKITKYVNNLGFILGDEGSGFSMGRYIIQDYFYEKMPASDRKIFFEKYNIDRDGIISKVYHEGLQPNTYIASFTAFLNECSAEYRKTVAHRSLSNFFDNQLIPILENRNIPCHFSGSISWYFKDIIEELTVKYNLKTGNIIQNPLDSLTYFNLKQIQN